jgi:hypothetical protein
MVAYAPEHGLRQAVQHIAQAVLEVLRRLRVAFTEPEKSITAKDKETGVRLAPATPLAFTRYTSGCSYRCQTVGINLVAYVRIRPTKRSPKLRRGEGLTMRQQEIEKRLVGRDHEVSG